MSTLWSDPGTEDGFQPNTARGAGFKWGPDETERFLRRNNLRFVVRGHEAVEGIATTHNG